MFMYKENLALNNLQGLIHHKIEPINQYLYSSCIWKNKPKHLKDFKDINGIY